MNHLSERVEAHCPRCNAAFVVAPSAQARKIQCPNCRRTIALGVAPAAPLPTDQNAARFAEIEARLARQEALIERLLARQTPVAEPVVAQPLGDSLLRPGQSLRWLQRDVRAWTATEEDPEQQSVLLHNLRAMGQRDIVVQVAENNEPGQRLAARLATVLREAGWKVAGPNPTVERRVVHGLIIAAGECPMPKAATAAYMALQAAGFPVTSRLDSTLGAEGWILIAGIASPGAS